jgi:hypothetical protein
MALATEEPLADLLKSTLKKRRARVPIRRGFTKSRTHMSNVAVTYKGFVLIPLAAFDEGAYTAMVIVEQPDQSQRASGILERFSNPDAACRYAVECGMAEVDRRLDGKALIGPTTNPRTVLANLVTSVTLNL